MGFCMRFILGIMDHRYDTNDVQLVFEVVQR